MPIALTGSGAFWRHPRRPLAGVALAAVGGILLDETLRRHFTSLADNPWPVAGWFLILAALFCLWPRSAVFWPLLLAGYAALHGFYSAPVPATLLAARLDTGTPDQPRAIRAVGTILDVPRQSSPPSAVTIIPPGEPAAAPLWRCTLGLESAEVDGRHWPSHARVSLVWRGGPATLGVGSRFEWTGTADNLAPPRNPGEFDLAGWRRRHDIFSEIRVNGLADAHALPGVAAALDEFRARAAAFAAACRARVAACLALDLDDAPDVRAVVSTMLLGLHGDSGLGDELESLFQRTGTLHYFAVDGLKLGLVGALCLGALRFAGFSRRTVGLCALPLLAIYALAAGLGPASVRAVFVAAVLVGGIWLDRPAPPGNSLGAAASLLLLGDTRSLFDVGFLLTFLVMLAILTLARPLSGWLRRFGAPDPFLPRALYSRARSGWEWLRVRALDLAAVALAAWVGSLPVMLFAFGWVSPISPLANVLAFPLAFAVLALGALSVAGGCFFPAWAVCMNNANWLLAKAFLCMVRLCDAVPGGSVHAGDPSLWHWTAPAAEITLLDTSGAGELAHLWAGRGADWLVDAARPSGYARVGRSCLRAGAVERLGGGLLLTQSDAAHLGAATLALDDFRPGRIVEAAPPSAHSPTLQAFRRALAARGGPPETFYHAGDTFALGPGVSAVVLAPPAAPPPGQRVTAASRALAWRLEAEGWRVLFLPASDEAEIALPPEALRCDVLVSPRPPSPETLRLAAPTWTLLQDAGIRERIPPSPSPGTFSQRQSGALTLTLYSARMEVRGFVDGTRAIRPR